MNGLSKKQYEILKRMHLVANYIIDTQCTIREVADYLGVSKTTITKDIDRLKEINLRKYNRVREIINYNTSVRHIRAGVATKVKHLEIDESIRQTRQEFLNN